MNGPPNDLLRFLKKAITDLAEKISCSRSIMSSLHDDQLTSAGPLISSVYVLKQSSTFPCQDFELIFGSTMPAIFANKFTIF